MLHRRKNRKAVLWVYAIKKARERLTSRKTSKGTSRYRDAEDVFILFGAEDLVPVSGGYPSKSQYGPRAEGLFGRITYHCKANNDHWEVKSKYGLTSYYGTLVPQAMALPP